MANNSEIKNWVEKALLANEDLVHISGIKIAGNTDNGDGYMGNLVFVDAIGTTRDHQQQHFHLVVKCSKSSQALRDTLPVQEAFLREILVYDKIFPAMRRFQHSKSVKEVFNSVPKYYQKFVSKHQEILVLENLKSHGYELWDKKKPLTTEHLLMLCRQYGRFHAISVAMQDQEPDQFKELVNSYGIDIFKGIYDQSDWQTVFENDIQLVYDLLKNDGIDGQILDKWLGLKEQLNTIFHQQREDRSCLNVLTHGDCWCNNFMFKHDENDKQLPVKSIILDWQIAYILSPTTDLSYLLFSNMNKMVANNPNLILDEYYEAFSNSLKEMGSDPDELYTKETFLKDWKQFARFGLVMAPLVLKLGLVEKDQAPDIAKGADAGTNISETFNIKLNNDTSLFKDRMANVIKCAALTGLLD